MNQKTRTWPPMNSAPSCLLPVPFSNRFKDIFAAQEFRHPGGSRYRNTGGFSLIELMIVLAIIGIIATGVVFMFANPSAKSKNQAFTLLGDLNMARSEAVNRNEGVLVDFVYDVSEECETDITKCTVGGDFDGYVICVDSVAPVGECNPTDTILRTTLFNKEIQYYDPTSLPTDGPATTPTSGSTANNLIGDIGTLYDDGGSVASFSMESDGTMADTKNINVVIFVPGDTHNEISGAPFAAIISSSTGRIRISRWTENAWKTK